MAQGGENPHARIPAFFSSAITPMKEFQDRVAVVTGGASGLGRAMALRFAREGMKIVLADIQADALKKTEAEFEQAGIPVLAVRTDVSKGKDVEALKVFDELVVAHPELARPRADPCSCQAATDPTARGLRRSP